MGGAVLYMKENTRDQQGKFPREAPIDFLPRRWVKHVLRKDSSGALVASRRHYEPALLTTLNERLKSGDVTVSHSRRWSDFEEYLIPRQRWVNERAQHYAALHLPLDADRYLSQLHEQLKGVTATVDRRAPANPVLKNESAKG